MSQPWLQENVIYDPYEEPDYPQPQEPALDRPQYPIPIFDPIRRYRSPEIDRSVRVYTVAQESRFGVECVCESVVI